MTTNAMPTVTERITSAGPKKILTCDGGGIRGLISVEILGELEARLRVKLGRPELVLADYFDFICGTSTGAIIAACLSTGMSTSTLRDFYVGSGRDMFDKASILKRLQYKYDDEPLARKLRAVLNDKLGCAPGEPAALLGDGRLRTMLMMVLRNHSTDSPWPVSNNPFARYNASDRPDCNLRLPLWQLVRASTAAPTYFPPEVVTFAQGSGREYSFVFVDGGVTTYNNPAFLAFLMATAAPYRVNWKTGIDDLLLVSVGTGGAATVLPDIDPSELNLLHYASNVPSALMHGASAGWDMACRTLGACTFGAPIDREVGQMLHDPTGAETNWTGKKAFTYVRYDPDLSKGGLQAIGVGDIDPATVQKMDSYERLGDLQRVGKAYAGANVSLDHLRIFA